MKKVFAIMAIVAFAACNNAKPADAASDTTKKDTTKVVVDTTKKVVDTTKKVVDTTKKM